MLLPVFETMFRYPNIVRTSSRPTFKLPTAAFPPESTSSNPAHPEKNPPEVEEKRMNNICNRFAALHFPFLSKPAGLVWQESFSLSRCRSCWQEIVIVFTVHTDTHTIINTQSQTSQSKSARERLPITYTWVKFGWCPLEGKMMESWEKGRGGKGGKWELKRLPIGSLFVL